MSTERMDDARGVWAWFLCVAAAVLMAMWAAVAGAQPPTGFRVVASPDDVLSWPITSTVTQFRLGNGQIVFDHSKRGQWPGVPISADGTLQEATLWVCFRIGYCTGAERFRPGQTTKALGHPNDIGPGWLYASQFGPMQGYIPQENEPVWFFMASGSTRLDTQTTVRERTNIIQITWSKDGGSWPPFPWVEGMPPIAAPVGPQAPNDPPVDVSGLQRQIDELRGYMAAVAHEQAKELEPIRAALDDHKARIDDLGARVAELQGRPIYIGCEASLFGVVPVACGFTR